MCSRDSRDPLSPYGPHGHLEHVHLSAGIDRFSMKSIFKSWFHWKNLHLLTSESYDSIKL